MRDLIAVLAADSKKITNIDQFLQGNTKGRSSSGDKTGSAR